MLPDVSRSEPLRTNDFVRRHSRVPFSVPVAIHQLKAGIAKTVNGLSLDLSVGGFGVLVKGDLKTGDTVELEFPLMERQLRLIAIVRYSSVDRSGLEFLGLTQEERTQISAHTVRTELATTQELARLMK